jgi:ubiquinone/menaquinone biosynthesis C-methylase UbiE
MSDAEQWQLHGNAAELYERHLVPAITSLWAADLVERAAPHAGQRVLDLACGTGIVARIAAARMCKGRIVGVDINPAMLAVARSLSTDARLKIEWQEGSALALPFSDDSFDLIFCQLGLQFFPDKRMALHEMRRVLTGDGRLALSVFTSIGRTPASNALADALDRHLGAGASKTKRSEHVLSDAEALRGLVTEAGFRNVEMTTVTQMISFPSAGEYVRLQLSATPLSSLLDGMGSELRLATVDRITGDLIASLQLASEKTELRYPQEAYVLLAIK